MMSRDKNREQVLVENQFAVVHFCGELSVWLLIDPTCTTFSWCIGNNGTVCNLDREISFIFLAQKDERTMVQTASTIETTALCCER